MLPAAPAVVVAAEPRSVPASPDWQALRNLLHCAAQDAAARGELTRCIDDALRAWPAAPSVTASSLEAIEAPRSHDDYFRIGRSAGDAAAGYIGGVGRAFALWLDEAHGDELHAYRGLGEVLLAMWAQAWSSHPGRGLAPLAALAGAAVLDDAPIGQRAADPLRRWLRGHQLFAVLTQGMLWSLERLPVAFETGDDALAEQVLLSLAALYRASAMAFRFTAEFDPQVYADVLRPTMCEPYMPKGFSGTLSSDHGVFVARLTALRDTLAAAQAGWPEAYALMRSSLSAVYDNHRFVCERFDGANVPSLRTQSACGDTSAVEMLDRFRARRLEMLR